MTNGYMDLYQTFDPPYETFDRPLLGPDFPQELSTVSALWFACRYRPGIAAYLNFFLLKDFIVTHDTAYPPRFQSFQSMADSFYQTDLFIRAVTDSGLKPTGGISSQGVRARLQAIMKRHERISIPLWMMTYFGFNLLESVEKQCAPLTKEQKQQHLSYMAKTYRIMGLAFSGRRAPMEAFARGVEEVHAGLTPNVEKHARNILIIGEMAGVSSRYEDIAAMLPDKTREVYREIHNRVRPGPLKRPIARLLGRVLMKQAIGEPRPAVPVSE